MKQNITKTELITELRSAEKRIAELERALIKANSKADTAKLKQAVEGLRHSEEKYHSLMEASDALIIMLDGNGRCEYVNDKAAQYQGMKASDAIGKNLREMLPKPVVERYSQWTQKVLAEDKGIVVETTIGQRWHRTSIQPVHDENGKTVMVLISAFDITELKTAQNELLEANRSLEERVKERAAEALDLYDNAPAGYHSVDENGLIVLINQTELNWLGYAREELVGVKHYRDLLMPQSQQRFDEYFPRYKAQGWIKEQEIEIIRKDGSLLPVLLNGNAIYDSHGKFVQSRSFIIDITARKQTEENLRESEERLSFVLEGSQLGYWDWDMETGEVKRNARWTEMLGYTLAEIDFNVKQWSDLHHPDDRAMAWKSIQDHLEGRTQIHKVEYRMRAKDGQYKWILDCARVVKRDAQGRPLRMSGTHTDITESKQAEELLYQSERQMQALVNSLDDIVFELDEQGTFLQVWTANEGLLFLPKAEILGKRADEILGKEFAAPFVEALKRTLTTGQFEDIEYPLKVMSGQRWFMARINPIPAPEGTVRTVSMLVRDITERKQADEKLRESERTFKLFIDYAPAAIAMFDRDMKYLAVSQRYLADYRLPDQDIVGRSHYEIFPEISERVKEVHRRCLAGAIEKSEEDAFPRADGTLDWVRWEVHPWHDQSGKIGGILLFSEVVTQRKLAKDALRASEEKYRSLMEASDALIIMMDGDGRIEYANERAAQSQHLKTADVIGKNIQDLASAGSADRFLQWTRNVIAGNAGMVFETAIRKNWYRTSILPVHDENGNAVMVLISAFDITELKTTQNDLLELNRTLDKRVQERTSEVQALYDNAPAGYHSLDEHGMFVMINQTELNWLGYTREEVIGVKSLRDVLTADSQQIFKKGFQLFMEQGLIKDVDLEVIRKDGSIFPILLNATTIYDDSGKFNQSRATMFDITERRKAERALLESEETYRTLFENANDAVFLIDRQGTFVRCNSRCEHLLGYSIDEMMGHNAFEFIVPRQNQEAGNRLERVLAGEYMPAYERSFRKKDGTEIETEIDLSLVYDENHQPKLIQSMVRDITERKKAEEALRNSRDELSIANIALEKAARLKDEFLASMSHELRTPLTGILGFSEALQLKTYGDLSEKQLRTIKFIEASGVHLLALINDILDLSKIEAGKVELQIEPCSLADICKASLQLTKGMAGQKRLRLGYSGLTEPVLMQADARRVKQILVNLLSNAIKFTPEEGELGLDVQVDRAEQVVRLTVWDKGIGIRPENLHRLFQPFTQIDSSLAREYTGTGLGLSLAQRLTEMHNGSVEVQSVFGEGSRFTVSLPWLPQNMPADKKQNAADGRADPALSAANAQFPLVLIADDNEVVLEVFADFLVAKQHRVTTVRSGMELLAKVAEARPDIMLVDIQMPGMDGLETIRRIRAHADAQVAATPIIAVTALAMAGDRERCINAGANEYMSKPVKLEELVMMIQREKEKKYE